MPASGKSFIIHQAFFYRLSKTSAGSGDGEPSGRPKIILMVFGRENGHIDKLKTAGVDFDRISSVLGVCDVQQWGGNALYFKVK